MLLLSPGVHFELLSIGFSLLVSAPAKTDSLSDPRITVPAFSSCFFDETAFTHRVAEDEIGVVLNRLLPLPLDLILSGSRVKAGKVTRISASFEGAMISRFSASVPQVFSMLEAQNVDERVRSLRIFFSKELGSSPQFASRDTFTAFRNSLVRLKRAALPAFPHPPPATTAMEQCVGRLVDFLHNPT